MSKKLKSSFPSQRGVIQLPILIGLLILAVALPAATRLVQQRQEIRGRAADNQADCEAEGHTWCGSGSCPDDWSYGPGCWMGGSCAARDEEACASHQGGGGGGTSCDGLTGTHCNCDDCHDYTCNNGTWDDQGYCGTKCTEHSTCCSECKSGTTPVPTTPPITPSPGEAACGTSPAGTYSPGPCGGNYGNSCSSGTTCMCVCQNGSWHVAASRQSGYSSCCGGGSGGPAGTPTPIPTPIPSPVSGKCSDQSCVNGYPVCNTDYNDGLNTYFSRSGGCFINYSVVDTPDCQSQGKKCFCFNSWTCSHTGKPAGCDAVCGEEEPPTTWCQERGSLSECVDGKTCMSIGSCEDVCPSDKPDRCWSTAGIVVCCAASSGGSSTNADFNSDGEVNEFDYGIVIANFGEQGTPGEVIGDVNSDGEVDEFDYGILIARFGEGE